MDTEKEKEKLEEQFDEASFRKIVAELEFAVAKHYVELHSAGIEQRTNDPEQKLETASPNNKRLETIPEFNEAKTIEMSQQDRDFVYRLCRERFTFSEILQIMGVKEGRVDPLELSRVIMDAADSITAELNEQGNTQDQALPKAVEDEFEAYDPVKWEIATEGNKTVDSFSDMAKAEASGSPQAPPGTPTSEHGTLTSEHCNPNSEHLRAVNDSEEPSQCTPTREEDFVRALTDSKKGSKPYFREGDILRVINKSPRGGVHDADVTADKYFELLPLKPPGEAGQAPRENFESADLAAAEAVGEDAKTGKEKDSYHYAMGWKD